LIYYLSKLKTKNKNDKIKRERDALKNLETIFFTKIISTSFYDRKKKFELAISETT
jgi:hypothetical protein